MSKKNLCSFFEIAIVLLLAALATVPYVSEGMDNKYFDFRAQYSPTFKVAATLLALLLTSCAAWLLLGRKDK